MTGAEICRVSALLLSTVVSMTIGTTAVFAQEMLSAEPRIDFDLKVSLEKDRTKISGKVALTGWFEDKKGGCLFIPFNWAQYGNDRGALKRFNDITRQKTLPNFIGGGSNLLFEKPVVAEATNLDHIVRLKVPEGWSALDKVNFEIESIVPNLPDSSDREHFIDGFLPVFSTSCAGELPPNMANPRAVHYSGSINIPEPWQFVGIGKLDHSNVVNVDTRGRSFAFALMKGVKRHTKIIADIPTEIIYRSDEFKKSAEDSLSAITTLSDILGKPPFSALVIAESDELQRNNIPGFIALNNPSQTFASKMQKDWLNWMRWSAVTQLSRQWFGASIDATPDDEWMISGLVEFCTLLALTDASAFDLFKKDENGKQFLTFNYLQMSEFTAASLRRLAPFTALTSTDRLSLDSSSSQHGLAYIRHAFALRQIMHSAGKKEFFSFLRSFTATFENSDVTPEEFYQFIFRLPSPFNPTKRKELAEALLMWWSDYGWPDFEIKEFETQESGDHYSTRVVVSQQGTIDFPPIIAVKDDAGDIVSGRAMRTKEGYWEASLKSRFRPTKSIVDPDHESFDANRFNNQTGLPRLTFFPGSGNTIHDDKYTIVWFPYGYRLPGEPVTAGLGGAVFKYVQSGILGRIEYAPSTRKSAYQLRQLYSLPQWALKGELSVNYDFDNDRVTELNAIRSPIFSSRASIISGQVKVRHKDHPGDSTQTHQAFGGDLVFKPKGQTNLFDYNVSTETEVSPEQGKGFSYRRTRGVALGGVTISEKFGLGVRYFRGKSQYTGEPPQTAFFKPNEIKEANLKIDIQGLPRSADLVSWEGNLSFPFYLPLPKDSFVLARQIQWRIYTDWGKAYDLDTAYYSRGIGLVLPLGGDISGVGSLAITRFTLLTILSSGAGDETKKKPGFAFDITGEL